MLYCWQVYGETSFELVDQIIQMVNFTADDRFIDLGSGKFEVQLIPSEICPILNQQPSMNGLCWGTSLTGVWPFWSYVWIELCFRTRKFAVQLMVVECEWFTGCSMRILLTFNSDMRLYNKKNKKKHFFGWWLPGVDLLHVDGRVCWLMCVSSSVLSELNAGSCWRLIQCPGVHSRTNCIQGLSSSVPGQPGVLTQELHA